MIFSRLPDAAVWPIKIAALAVVYYTAAKLGLALAFAATNASPVWPPSGIALAALLLLGYRVWPGITLGAFVANVTVFAANNAASSAVVAAVSATIAVGNTLEALLGALLLNRLLGSRSPFDRPQDVFWFLIITVGVCLVGASVGTTSLVASDIVPQSAQLVIWLTWWLGDAAGMLIVSPLLIAWLRRTTVAHARGSVRQTLEVIAFIAGLMVIGAIVFRGEFGADPRARLLLYLFIPCLAWAAYRHGTRGAATASLIIASMAVWATIHHRGPLDGNNVNTSLILLACFFGLFAVTGLLLAADMVERRELNGVKPTPRDVAAPWLVLFGCLAGAILGWHLVAADTQREARARFLTQANEVGARTVARIMAYEETLRGARGLFAASTSVSRDEWRQYIGQLDVEHNFPGLPGVGFAQYVTDADKLALERGAQADGLANYQVWPAGERGEYAPILYLEPASRHNLRAFGFDMFSDPVRRAAMMRARDSGLAELSGKVTLVQKDGDRPEAGVLVYLPVYRNGAATATPTERQRELIGYVYAPIRAGELMRGVLGAMMPGLALQVFDTDKPAPATMMYDSEAGRGRGNDLRPMFATQVPLTLNDHRWTLQLATLPAFENAIDTQKSQLVLLAGTIISLLLFVVFRSLAMTRQSALDMAAAAIRESADRFRSLAESANEAIIVCDAADGVVSWNRGAETIFGYRADEMIGRELSRLLPERYRDLLDPVMPRVAGGEALQLTGKTTEVSGLTRDGKEFPLDLSLATWESGQRRFYSAIMRDISVRKQSEDALRNSEERFRLLVDGVSDYAIITLDPDGTILSWNASAERINGYRADEILGQNFSRFYTQDRIERGDPQAVLKTAVAEGRFEEEGWRVRKDGGNFWASVIVTALRDESGTLRGFGKVTRDLTERKKSDDILEASERRFRSIMVHAPIGMAVVSLDGRWLEVNAALSEIVGYSKLELENLTFQDITHPNDLETDLQHVQELLDGKVRSYQMEKRYIRKNRESVWVKLTASLMRDARNEPLYFISQIEDISDRKEKEAAINLAFREKETLLKEVYHRVKNNLQVIISLLNMKMRTLPEGEYKGALLESVLRVRAMALVHEQLYQSRDLSSIILADYIRDLCRDLGATAGIEQRGITINCEGEPLAVDLEHAVPLGLLLNELITNSLKHAFPDGRRGAVRVSLSSAGENMACLVVADNGVGLPATPSTAPSTSTGLKLVEALSRQLDATLTFEINGGTRVSLVFPLRARAAANRSALPARAAKH